MGTPPAYFKRWEFVPLPPLLILLEGEGGSEEASKEGVGKAHSRTGLVDCVCTRRDLHVLERFHRALAHNTPTPLSGLRYEVSRTGSLVSR